MDPRKSATFYERSDVVGSLITEGFTDEAERQLLLELAPRLRGARVLDIGIGAGRTTTLLRLLTDDYVGIDTSEAMLRAARARHPAADLRLGDATRLQVADETVDAVCFSFNGLDNLDHEQRLTALAEMARVLRPGGVLLFSSLNRDGPDRRARPVFTEPLPWLIGSLQPLPVGAKGTVRNAVRTFLHLRQRLAGRARRRRLMAERVDTAEWSIMPMPAFEFGLPAHYTTPAGVASDLDRAGLRLVKLLAAEDGRPIGPGDDTTAVRWFEILAEKPGEAHKD